MHFLDETSQSEDKHSEKIGHSILDQSEQSSYTIGKFNPKSFISDERTNQVLCGLDGGLLPKLLEVLNRRTDTGHPKPPQAVASHNSDKSCCLIEWPSMTKQRSYQGETFEHLILYFIKIHSAVKEK